MRGGYRYGRPDEGSTVHRQRGDSEAEPPKRGKEPSLRKDGYEVRSRRPVNAEPGDIVSNAEANRREDRDRDWRHMSVSPWGEPEQEI